VSCEVDGIVATYTDFAEEVISRGAKILLIGGLLDAKSINAREHMRLHDVLLPPRFIRSLFMNS